MYNRPNGQTSMAAVQGQNRYLGTQDRPRQTELLDLSGHLSTKWTRPRSWQGPKERNILPECIPSLLTRALPSA
jgi:hypothetical protein